MASLAIVFGGTKGIGSAVAAKLLFSGYSVAVASRDKANVVMATDMLRKLTATLPDSDAQRNKVKVDIFGIECDVTDEKSVQNCFSTLAKLFPIPEVVVNAAGINEDKLLIRSSIANAKTILDTNLLGAICSSKEAVRCMIKGKKGTIINIGSVVGIKGNVGQTVYSASKSGLIGFTKSLAKEVGPKNIRVNLVAPGFIETDMTSNLSNLEQIRQTIPMRRFGTPEEVAEAVLFLTGSPYITGQVVIVDGGLSIA